MNIRIKILFLWIYATLPPIAQTFAGANIIYPQLNAINILCHKECFPISFYSHILSSLYSHIENPQKPTIYALLTSSHPFEHVAASSSPQVLLFFFCCHKPRAESCLVYLPIIPCVFISNQIATIPKFLSIWFDSVRWMPLARYQCGRYGVYLSLYVVVVVAVVVVYLLYGCDSYKCICSFTNRVSRRTFNLLSEHKSI